MVHNYKTVLLTLGWHSQTLMQGVVDYAGCHNWHLVVKRGVRIPFGVENWYGDGIIASLNAELLSRLPDRRTKILSLNTLRPGVFRLPHRTVHVDNREVGRIAADYFLKRGHVNFAVYSDTERMTGFRERLECKGFSCRSFTPREEEFEFIRKQNPLRDWLTELPKPCAVFCENDWDASDLLNTALATGIRVPQELAILGVNNDPVACCAPAVPLSSIDIRSRETGRTAAAELDRMLNGEIAPEGTVLLPPDPLVVERRSSDFFAVGNPLLAELLASLKEQAARPVSLGDLARRFYVSESAVYKLFTRHLGISPKQFLRTERLRRACGLMLDTDLTLEDIAGRAGFPTACALFCAFRKEMGVPPGVWRKERKTAGTGME